jgi:hypothetical protein
MGVFVAFPVGLAGLKYRALSEGQANRGIHRLETKQHEN